VVGGCVQETKKAHEMLSPISTSRSFTGVHRFWSRVVDVRNQSEKSIDQSFNRFKSLGAPDGRKSHYFGDTPRSSVHKRVNRSDRDAVWVMESDGGPEVLRDVAMVTNFGTQFALTGFVGYNFCCMIASDTLFDSRGGFSGSGYPMKT